MSLGQIEGWSQRFFSAGMYTLSGGFVILLLTPLFLSPEKLGLIFHLCVAGWFITVLTLIFRWRFWLRASMVAKEHFEEESVDEAVSKMLAYLQKDAAGESSISLRPTMFEMLARLLQFKMDEQGDLNMPVSAYLFVDVLFSDESNSPNALLFARAELALYRDGWIEPADDSRMQFGPQFTKQFKLLKRSLTPSAVPFPATVPIQSLQAT